MSDYKGGRIIRIKLKGFMTYDELEIRPKSGLNLIIGLNGSGKSSIMAAICLGLGGKPIHTGRSVQSSELINFKHSKAVIEIDLESQHGGKETICRIIERDKSLWYLNNSQVSYNEIISIVKKYNIDMGNLCQFLPQEKVAEFAKMNKKQRLENMIQAIGEPALVKSFVDLKKLRNEFCALEKEVDRLGNSKNSEIKMNERLKPDIIKHNEIFELKSELKALKIKKKIILFKDLKSKAKISRSENKKFQKAISDITNELNHLEAKKLHLLSNSRNYLQEISELNRKILNLLQTLSRCSKDLNHVHEEVDNAKITYQHRKTKNEEEKAKLCEMERQIEALKIAVQNQTDLKEAIQKVNEEYTDINNKISELHSVIENLKVEHSQLKYKKESCMAEKEKLSNEEKRKFEIVERRFPDTYKAILWLQANQSSFRTNVSLPGIISINVHSHNNRKFIENAISLRDLLLFVFEDQEDLQRFVKIVKEEKKLNVNVALVPKEKLIDFQSPPLTPEIRDVGVKCFMKDLFTAPDPVMRVLCKLNRVHRIPLCDEKSEENIERVLNINSLFFTPLEKIMGKRSQYGNRNISVRKDSLKSRNMLPNIKDNSEAVRAIEESIKETEKLCDELNSQLNLHLSNLRDFEKSREAIRNRKHQLNENGRKNFNIQIKLVQLINMYEKKQRDVIDEKEERNIVTQKICVSNKRRKRILMESERLFKDFIQAKKKKAHLILMKKILESKLSSLKTKMSDIQASLNEKKKAFDEKTAEYTSLKEEMIRIYAELGSCKTEVAPISSQDISLEEVNSKITRIEILLETSDEDFDSVLSEYKKRETAIINIEEEIEELKQKSESLKLTIQQIKRNWLPPLQAHVENINNKFSNYYKFLQCAGEISLDTTDDSDDFPNYGLQIKLKYRIDEDFMELSQTHHSGGECSVAAIIFILSLQELAEVPFRCIDEINQGMDALNERKMYQLVAEAAINGSCSQYFLLTPKLLMDLNYHKDIAVHIIYNSPYLQTKLDTEKHIKIQESNKRADFV
ncbi:structural maintenance of chromosomes protein 5 [Caerostris darwini]|uniref:Structural maintenance of chromosomes protein 5 n=1 Tax=Caerostris darwini TaxID=1538125 RepID=A0AAV4UL55_9ARAC|nr:structural maintenance of chromosomes protein 5 [Caerostris darwini]